MQRTVIGKLASMIGHMRRLEKHPAPNRTASQVEAEILDYVRRNLPRGSGIDNGTAIMLERSTEHKVVLRVDFHHMDEHGCYDGWASYTLTIQPAFDHILINVKGADKRNQIHEYLHEVYQTALTAPVDL